MLFLGFSFVKIFASVSSNTIIEKPIFETHSQSETSKGRDDVEGSRTGRHSSVVLRNF